MTYDTLLDLIGQYGYAALFFALWLGIVGMPIPDEVIVMTGGAVTAGGLLHTIPAFVLTYLGVVSGLTLGYVLGRYIGTPVLDKLRRKKNMNQYIEMSQRWSSKYGSLALVISYFFPVIRHVMPYIVGLNKMPFSRYALFSYTTGLLWTLIFFTAGRLTVDHAAEVGMTIYRYGLNLLWVPFAACFIYVVFRLFLRKKRESGSTMVEKE
ncbi:MULTISPECIES: DedA family protein [Paenibacillus]|uniref:DedA family protein n=1 Tax=Paenibacillus TaxID=44249 RepID=UPI0008881126|nr:MULTISPECIES: DedA family protein [Paenibacillus]NTZ17105.1 DedA family protein [Paenibacillus sp. JMULE4]GCL72797.1 DedA family protein [Paenibacillus naphthalenovorans]SDI09281.1 membrane protein DedA, SNARE-associated domain [Paenibacillus naphthalenovorans]